VETGLYNDIFIIFIYHSLISLNKL